MAKVLILGGGFGGVIAAETLVRKLSEDHQITLVSQDRRFLFHPALVRLAFGKCEPDDVSFDLRKTMVKRRVNFMKAEVARVDPHERTVTIAHGEMEGLLTYDYLIFALGRRLATEKITGFYEHANHILTVEAAMKFGEAVRAFEGGRAVIGQCPGARLPVPVYEAAFALSRFLESKGKLEHSRITIVSPDPPGLAFGDAQFATALRSALDAHFIEFLPDFPIERITADAVLSSNGHALNYNLLMLLPPFRGSSAVSRLGITNEEGYINVNQTMRVVGVEGMYAVGDCVNFSGPKMGHMAVRQAEVAAGNVAAEIAGLPGEETYNHELMFVIEEGGSESIYLHKDLWTNEPGNVRQGRFWNWAKKAHEKYWEASHS